MYEWFYSPVDYGWFREHDFLALLQDTGLGHVTHLTRIEWSFVRSLFGCARRLSPAFLASERHKLHIYREEVRTLRRLQSVGGSTKTSLMEAELGLLPPPQMAVGQRVTACHPKERQIYTGTVLTPDGDHYRVQFDRPVTKLNHQQHQNGKHHTTTSTTSTTCGSRVSRSHLLIMCAAEARCATGPRRPCHAAA